MRVSGSVTVRDHLSSLNVCWCLFGFPSSRHEGEMRWLSTLVCACVRVCAHLHMQDHTLALLNAVGGSGRGGSRRVGGRQGRLAAREARFSEDGSLYGTQEPADQPGTLGAKLQELGRRLLQVRLRCTHDMSAAGLAVCVHGQHYDYIALCCSH